MPHSIECLRYITKKLNRKILFYLEIYIFYGIFQLTLQTSTFPDHWKLVKVMSIFKNGNKSLVSNYRPISLLSCVGKTFERVVFKHVSNYFLDNKLLCKYQSGFVPGCSTVHQLIEIFHKICIYLDKKHIFFITKGDKFCLLWIKFYQSCFSPCILFIYIRI
jgi:hypothetical protein